MVRNVQLTGYVPKMARIDNQIIGFTVEDARRLHHPHDDAFVISICIGDYNTHHNLVDNGSSAYILYYLAFQQMSIGKKRLFPTNVPFIGFGRKMVHPLRAVTLLVTVEDYPQQITRDVTFLVVDCSSAYNAILGRPTLNSWKAVTSTYHLMIKFPTDYGVGEVRGDQVAARKCYIAMLEINDYLETMCIEGLEEVLIDDSRPEQTTRIGTLASQPVHQALMTFLRGNQDVRDGQESQRKAKDVRRFHKSKQGLP